MKPPETKILIVDDDDEIRSLLQVVLCREGFDVQQAKDGPTARRLLGPGKNVDLVILDIMMPGEDGLSFCQKLRDAEHPDPDDLGTHSKHRPLNRFGE